MNGKLDLKFHILSNNSLPHSHPVGNMLAGVHGGVGPGDVEEGGDGLARGGGSPTQPGISRFGKGCPSSRQDVTNNNVLLPKTFIIIIIITRPWPAYGRHGLAGSSGGDQYGRINSSHFIIEELARSDWMGLSGGDQSGRINS